MLEDCSAVIILDQGHPVLYPAVFDLDGEDDSLFLNLVWTNEDGEIFEYDFLEGANQEIRTGETVMILTATDGSKVDIQILNVTPLDV